MLRLNDGLFPKALVLQHIVVVLLTHSCGGRSQLVRPPPPSVALVGDDIILPCHLQPAADAASIILEWGRPDLEPRFVHVWHEGQDLLANQNPSYRGRTSVSRERLKQGDLSLTLSSIKLSDAGTYRCFLPKQRRESTVQLIVGAVSSPVIVSVNRTSTAVVLQCESAGWYPEPEVLWLDGEGHLVSAGPPETVRGPDDLYTVSSRVTVEKRHGNSFTCRVQQRNINQTTQTHITVADERSAASSGTAARISVTLAAVSMFTLAVVFMLWKMTANKSNAELHPADDTEEAGQREPLVANSKSREDLEEMRKKLDQQQQERAREQKHFALVVDMLKDQVKQLETLREKLDRQKKDMEEEEGGTEKQVQAVEEETKRDKAKGYLRLKEILLEEKSKVRRRRGEHEQLLLSTDKLLLAAGKVLREINMDADNQSVTRAGEDTGSRSRENPGQSSVKADTGTTDRTGPYSD